MLLLFKIKINYVIDELIVPFHELLIDRSRMIVTSLEKGAKANDNKNKRMPIFILSINKLNNKKKYNMLTKLI